MSNAITSVPLVASLRFQLHSLAFANVAFTQANLHVKCWFGLVVEIFVGALQEIHGLWCCVLCSGANRGACRDTAVSCTQLPSAQVDNSNLVLMYMPLASGTGMDHEIG